MVNIPIIPPASDIHTELLPDISQTWKVGQVLHATVERGGENLDKILLRIGHQLVESKTPLPLKTGEHLKVLVKTLGEAPLLGIITQPSTAQLAASQLRHFIQAQQDWRPLIALVTKLLASPATTTQIKPLLQQFLQQLPDMERLSQAQSLRQLINHSGVLLESRLNHQQSVAGDTKALLQQIQSQLQNLSPVAGKASHPEQAIRLIETWLRHPLPPPSQITQELGALITPNDMRQLLTSIQLQQLEQPLSLKLMQLFAQIQKQHGNTALEQLLNRLGEQNNIGDFKAAISHAISHISQQQLQPLLRDGDNTLLLMFGLPMRHDHDTHWINFRIERETNNTEKDNQHWHVTLNFDIAELGPLQAKLHLTGNQLSTLFRASQSNTIEKIRQHLPQLHKALEHAGLTIAKLAVLPGPVEKPAPLNSSTHILDERA